jgi:hypothetical protein
MTRDEQLEQRERYYKALQWLDEQPYGKVKVILEMREHLVKLGVPFFLATIQIVHLMKEK